MEIKSDLKEWYAISCPTTGLRFDSRTLELLDANRDGHIRTEEVQAALAFLKERGVEPEQLAEPDPDAEARLADVLKRIAELDKAEPSADYKKALADWEAEGAKPEVAVCGDATAAADAALAAVEKEIDAFFTPPDDMPLVTEEPDKTLPLKDHINPKHVEAVMDFAAKCVVPVLGERDAITRLEWKKVKAAFAPYRAWAAAKPVASAPEKAGLEAEERLVRYRMNLGEFLENYVTMDRLYGGKDWAMFQTGVLRIDAKELNLCFHVASEAAHSALSGRSECCVIYLKLTRPDEGAERTICAVVTAGTVGGLYVGRNGVFYDRDGRNWEATITKVVEAQVSLAEAFWAPWKKLGAAISGAVKKFLGEREAAADAKLATGAQNVAAGKKDGAPGAGGAALASSVAAIGIGVGMVGAAAASLMAAVKGMGPWQAVLAVVAIILVVSLPSVILTWFKLRRRDLGAILNAGGWAVNRQMRFSMKRARAFTKCARTSEWWLYALLAAIVLGLLAYTAYMFWVRLPAAAAA
ncbi:MAG: hypothetical protein IKE55_09190 [Kiritimatiellae bacterium]|nr:hypothetical protein [Kiritimatiellia bacterium]